MSEWKEYKLGDICTKIGSGATPTGGKGAYLGGDFSLIRSQNVLDNSFTFNGLAKINKVQAKKLDGVTVEEQDILLNITGDSVARSCMVDVRALPARVNQHVAIIRLDKTKAEPKFVLAWLQHTKPELLNLASFGATRNAITKKMIQEYPILLPELKFQHKIAAILSSLDDKIETNRAINARLEELAAAIFKSWFIDFEPFGGVMPKDWEVKAFDEIVDVIAGGTPKTEIKNYWDGNIPWISVKDFVNELHFVMQTERFITEDGLNHSATHLLNPGDTIISARGTVGALAQIQQPMAFNQSCFGLRSKLDCGEHWLYFLLRNKVHDLKQNAHGSVFDTINRKTLSALSIIKPPIEILYDFHNIVNPLIKEIHTLSKESSHLATLRDTLLPRLMSGELIPE